jgi:uncharacterized protein YpbB
MHDASQFTTRNFFFKNAYLESILQKQLLKELNGMIVNFIKKIKTDFTKKTYPKIELISVFKI